MIIISSCSYNNFRETTEDDEKTETIKEEKVETLTDVVLSLTRSDSLRLDEYREEFLNKNNVLFFVSKGINPKEENKYLIITFSNLNEVQCYFYSNYFSSEWSINEMIVNRFAFRPFNKKEKQLIDLYTSPTPKNIENACFLKENKNSLILVKYIKTEKKGDE